MKTLVSISTLFATALSAGFFFAWSVSVILGTKKVGDYTYLETMQNINREILNPVFFMVFFGSLFLLIFNTYLHFNSKLIFALSLTATAIYFVGTICITAMGNVPLNDELDALNLSLLSMSELQEFRSYYESKWNRYHSVRTIAAMISFIGLLLATYSEKIL